MKLIELLDAMSYGVQYKLLGAMTGKQLAEWLDLHGECNQCAYHPVQCSVDCNEGHLKWLRQDVPEVGEYAVD